MLKAFGDGNEFSKEMVNYPAKLDEEFYKDYLEQKEEWPLGVNYSDWDDNIVDSLEIAIS